MSELIRSASASPFAAARPLLHSRRVSLRMGAFGLTYSTDRLLWDPESPPVDPAPAVETQPRAESQTAPGSFPLDLEAARQQALWQAAQQQAAQQAAQQQAQAEGQKARAARSQVRADPVQTDPAQAGASSARAEGVGENRQAAQTGQAGQARTERSLRQAMRQATQAYLACARNFACPGPMLQAVA